GAIALCLGEAGAASPCAGLTPAQIVAKMRSDAAATNDANTWFGFTGDPLRPLSGRYYGHLQYAGVGAPVRPAPSYVAVTAAPVRATLQWGSLASGTVSALAADDTALFRVNSGTSSAGRQTAWYGSFTGVPATLRDLKVTYKGSNSRTCTQVVEIYRWNYGWVALDTRSVGTTEVAVASLAVGGTLSSYVSGGELRVRVRCTTTSGSFVASGNLLRISYSRPA
ncbi:MAG TPA: hypothetical protein VHF89_02575, partial [Solirubrobacteraceae bacterium]|nr:hypothetical protein [Solirubrobacteraceae bacterium]